MEEKNNHMVEIIGVSKIESFPLRWNLWLPILIGIIYWLVNRPFGGPAYQQDEIGYLANAAFFAGYVFDGYSSYHAGYSFFLAPLFTFLSEPEEVWKGVQVVNALFWGGSFYLLDAIVRKSLPSVTLPRRVLAIVVSATYPAWLIMAGYAFSQSAFVFFFTASTLALFGWRPEKPASVLLHTTLVGFLFWIHPTALGVVAASIIVIGLGCWMTGRYRSLLLHLALLSGLMIAYKAGLQVWMMSEMTPKGYNARGHYPSPAGIVPAAANARFWRDWFLVIFGQLAYLSIASLGIFVAGVFQLWKTAASQVFRMPTDTGSREFSGAMVSVFLLVSMLGVIVISATFLASLAHGPASLDEWFYGRYAEGVLLPLMAIGLAGWQRRGLKTSLAIASGIVVVGVFIQSFSAQGDYLNLINVQGLWPQSLFPGFSVAQWFFVGAVMMFIYIMFFGVVLLLPMFALFLLTVKMQLQWHENLLVGYSRPSEMIDFVRKNFPKAQCIGFDTFLPPGATRQMAERIRLYSFYLFDSGFRRIDTSQWNQSCDGPLFSYDTSIAVKLGDAKLVAKEPETKLMLFAHRQELMFNSVVENKKRAPVVWVNKDNIACVMAGCLSRSGAELKLNSQVGKLENNVLSTDGGRGFLFFGPYVSLEKGKYILRMAGSFDNVDGAVIDVVSDQGKSSHFRADLDTIVVPPENFIEFSFPLENNVADLEIRLYVEEATNIKIRSCQVVLSEID